MRATIWCRRSSPRRPGSRRSSSGSSRCSTPTSGSPTPAGADEWLYNFWRDAAHPKGLWRRTTFDEYRKDDPDWDVLIDVDALAAAEDENWVWGGAGVRRPDQDLALIRLSRGGADATVVREFDLRTRTFRAPEDGGWYLPEAKSNIGWIDADTVYVGTDFGDGSLTDSGYPRLAKRWRRGTPLAEAETVIEGEQTDVSVGAGYDRTPGYERHFVVRHPEFFSEQISLLEPDGPVPLDLPEDADVSWYKDWLTVRLKSDWTVGDTAHPAGALLVTDFPRFRAGKRKFEELFTPDAHTSLHGYGWTENYLLLATLADVQTKLHVLEPVGRRLVAAAVPGHAADGDDRAVEPRPDRGGRRVHDDDIELHDAADAAVRDGRRRAWRCSSRSAATSTPRA